jgi:hypothetical protein
MYFYTFDTYLKNGYMLQNVDSILAAFEIKREKKYSRHKSTLPPTFEI